MFLYHPLIYDSIPVDMNECDGDNDCDHICNNLHCTEGRYNCSCNSGYRLGKDDHSCIGESIMYSGIRIV